MLAPLQSPARNVTPSFFARRSPLVSDRQSEAVVGALQGLGLLAPNGTLLANPDKEDVSGVGGGGWVLVLWAEYLVGPALNGRLGSERAGQRLAPAGWAGASPRPCLRRPPA